MNNINTINIDIINTGSNKIRKKKHDEEPIKNNILEYYFNPHSKNLEKDIDI